MNDTIGTIAALGAQWLSAKAAEQEAVSNRHAIEARLAELMPAPSDEGTQKLDINDMQVRVEYGVSRKVDTPALTALWRDLPAPAQECFRWSAEPVLAKLRAVQSLLPDQYARMAACITTTPRKPAVKVSLKDDTALKAAA